MMPVFPLLPACLLRVYCVHCVVCAFVCKHDVLYELGWGALDDGREIGLAHKM